MLLPGKALNTSFDFGKNDIPVRQTMRITGFGIYPEPFSRRGESVFRNFAFHINDFLDSTITYNEKYSLVFMGNGEKVERNAFYRLSEDELKHFKGKRIKVSIPVKSNKLNIPETGYLILELQL